MDDYIIAKKEVDALSDTIIQSALDFMAKDPQRTLLAITATLNAGIYLVRAADMPTQMRKDFAKMMSSELQKSPDPIFRK